MDPYLPRDENACDFCGKSPTKYTDGDKVWCEDCEILRVSLKETGLEDGNGKNIGR